MKIFDAHVHLNRTDVTADNILRKMDENGVERCCLIAPHSMEFPNPRDEGLRKKFSPPEVKNILNLLLDKDKGKVNDFLAKIVSKKPDRLVGLARLNPLNPGAPKELERAVGLGLKGLKLFCIGWYPFDERVFPVYQKAAELNIPILFHTGILADGRNSRFHRPADFEIVKDFPRLRIIMAHLSWPWVDEALAVAGMGPIFEDNYQIHLDITPGAPQIWRKDALYKAVNYVSTGQLILGTDNTETGDHAREVIESIKKIFSQIGVSQEAQEDIFWNNAARLYQG